MTDRKSLFSVTFHGDIIYAFEHNGEPYAPVRPIVENMGLDWKTQFRKLCAGRERFRVVKITTWLPGDTQAREMVCMPARKLAGFLATINHNKVRNGLRAKVLAYQRECDDALWNYWQGLLTNGRQEAEPKGIEFPGVNDAAIPPSQRIRLLSLALRFARLGPAEKEAALESYGEFCRRAGQPVAKDQNDAAA
jgi:hypothetical protein